MVKTEHFYATLFCAFFCAGTTHALQLERLTARNLPEITVAPAPAPDRVRKEWTVLVYVSARNSLGIEAIKDVNEMEEAGSGDKVNVVAELGRIHVDPVYNPFTGISEPLPLQDDWTGSRRFLLKKDSDPLRITSPVLAFYPEADMGDWNHLAEFISWGKAKFPANKYLLIIGGHGSGWRGVKPPPGNKGISYDDVSKNHISPAELAKAIARAGGVDVYASDACLMQTFEVLYDLRNSAEFVVGSQETTPGTGYNYAALLDSMNRAPGSSLQTARQIADTFAGYYGAQKQSVTISVARPRAAGELARLLDGFAKLVLASPADQKLYNDKKFGLRNFDDEAARDLYQLMRLFYDNSGTPAVKARAEAVIRFLAQEFIAQNSAVGYKSKDANGVSIHFPLSYLDYQEKYSRLTFSADTSWDEMLRAVLGVK